MEQHCSEEEQKEQQLWSWGAGTDGQLATGKLRDEHSPQILRCFTSFGPISSLSCGGGHVIALTCSGRVLTWGRGSSGQLGRGETINCSQPSFVDALEDHVVSFVSAGWNHSSFVSDNGVLFTCGDGSFGQLGHGDYRSKSSPLEVSYFRSNHIEQVACGMRHTLVLLAEHKVYGFGYGKRGQLGTSANKIKSLSLPHITLGLTNVQVTRISANGDHSAALTASGSLYTWGRGFSHASDVCIPQIVDSAFSFNQVALGWNHALLLTKENILFMLGGDHHGVLGDLQETPLTKHGESKDNTLVRISDLGNTKVLLVAAGAEHSALVTYEGSVMTWGWGEHGQLGFGNTNNKTCPQAVKFGETLPDANRPVTSLVYCGSGFSFLLRKFDVHPKLEEQHQWNQTVMTSVNLTDFHSTG